MIGYDLLFGGAAMAVGGALIVRNAGRLGPWNALQSSDSDPGRYDDDWSYAKWLLAGRALQIFGILAIVWFVPVNMHIVHWPKYGP
ncbi:MAG TPA: hypothetical protein VFL13_09710 [Candidatus Baltobacteraceae bacterium]|nr:hypothetical protein [Candidatus Baltobacteraceae bacterium]